MDDLTSRKALLAAYDDRHKGPPGGARELIEDAPSIPAVPLDKLCEWMADNVYLKDDAEAAWELNSDNWKKLLTKWMEGLDATD